MQQNQPVQTHACIENEFAKNNDKMEGRIIGMILELMMMIYDIALF